MGEGFDLVHVWEGERAKEENYSTVTGRESFTQFHWRLSVLSFNNLYSTGLSQGRTGASETLILGTPTTMTAPASG